MAGHVGLAALVVVAGGLLLVGGRRAVPLLLFFLCGVLPVPDARDQPGRPVDAVVWEVTATAAAPGLRRDDWQRTPLRDLGREAGRGPDATVLEPVAHPDRSRGQVLRIRARVEPPGPPRNPGQRPNRTPLLRVDHPDQVQVLAAPSPGLGVDLWLGAVADWTSHRLDRMPARLGGMLRALLLGQVNALPMTTRRLYRDTGVYHLLVVSGWHVAILGALLFHGLRRLPLAGLLTLTGLALFAGMTGARPPVVRAALVFAIYLVGTSTGRSGAAELALGLAFVLFAWLRPEELATIGFQLSFVAVLGILAGQQYRLTWSPRGTGAGLQLWLPLLRGLHVSWFATLATAPLTAATFGSTSPWSPLTTLVVGPAILVVMTAGALVLWVGQLVPLVAECGAVVLDGLVAGIETFLVQVDRWPGTPLPCEAPSLFVQAVCVGVLLCWLRGRPGIAMVGLSLVTGVQLWSAAETPARLVLLDVGHGQCALLQTPSRTDLIDAGGAGRGLNHAREVRRTLGALGVQRLDGLFLSHLDRDHTGFATGLLEDCDVGELVLPAPVLRDRERDRFLERLLQVARQRGVPVVAVRRGDRVGPHRVLWPEDRHFLSDNERSLVLCTRFGTDRVLFPGDLTSYGLMELAGSLDPVTVLVLPHHGNPDPGLDLLLRRTAPLLALASRGAELPPETRADLRRHDVPVASTWRRGALTLPWRDGRADLARLTGHVTPALELR